MQQGIEYTGPSLRPELEALPARMRTLPIRRGYPVPWFVAWIDDEPEFRAMDPDKLVRAVKERRCWVCGDYLGRHMVFVLGPMCGVNRISAEAPCHHECAEFSARNCPFLCRPHARRRETGFTEGFVDAPGLALKRNPGVTLLWTTLSYELIRHDGGVLFGVGEPTQTLWYAEGKPATRAQVVASVESGLPLLLEHCDVAGLQQLRTAQAWLETHYPKD